VGNTYFQVFFGLLTTFRGAVFTAEGAEEKRGSSAEDVPAGAL